MIDPGLDDPSDLDYAVEADGRLVRRQLARKIWQRGAWATVAVHFQGLDATGETWRSPRVALVRLRKLHGRWRRHAEVTLATAAARELAATLTAWMADAGDDDLADD